MKSSLLLCTLPLAALAAPAWAQDECDKECQDTLDYERDQAHYGTRLPDRMVFEEPIPITAITANDIIVTGALKDAQSEAAFPFEPLSIGSRFSDRVEALAGSSGSLQPRCVGWAAMPRRARCCSSMMYRRPIPSAAGSAGPAMMR
jgi:hypothetical protein